MERHLRDSLRTHSALLDSSKTLTASTSSILFDQALSPSDFEGSLSPLSDGGFPDDDDPSDGESFPGDTDSKDGENEEDDELSHHRSPLSYYDYSSRWSASSNCLDSGPAWQPSRFGGMEDSGASEDSGVMDCNPRTDLDMKPCSSALFTEQKPSIMGAGLANLGNTCFLNVILQCFTHTVPLLQGLLARTHKVPCECYLEGFCAFCNLYEHIECALTNSGGVVYPSKFFNNLNYFSSCFQRFQQEDAHEFLQCFLDRLESCNDFKHADSYSIVRKVFGGRLVSKLLCCNCGHCSDTQEPIIDLSLEIDDVSTLSTALESFTKVEKLEDPGTTFTCENCKEKVSVEKQLVLEQAPSVAAFHLKRFKNDGSFVEKIDNHVAFPLELDLLPYTGGNQNDELVEMKYDLNAVVVHTGFSSTSGHYYCFIRAAPNEWYRFDDSKVCLVEQEFVLEQEAYILFYVKQGTPCFSSFRETHKQYMNLSFLNNSPKSVLDMGEVCTTSPALPRHCPYDAKETSNIACAESLSGSQDGEETPGMNDYRVVGDIDGKEEPVTPLPLVSCNPFHLASCDINKSASVSVFSNSSEGRPSFEACKSSSVPVVTADVPNEACQSTSLHVSDESNSIREHIELGNRADVLPTMPLTPRSPSPEIYREDVPDSSFLSIPRDHLKEIKRISCKRQLNKDLEDPGRKQACTFVKKNMTGSRGKQFMAAIRGPSSESSINKKRSRGTHISPGNDDRNSASRRRGGTPVLASSLR